jgi:hypothetical protein
VRDSSVAFASQTGRRTKGFEKSKLQNGVSEPLREADLIE